MAQSNPSLEEENRAIIEGLLAAGVECEAILTALYVNVAPHILNAALEDTVREAVREDPSVARRLALLGKGRGHVDPRSGRAPVFPTRRPFAPNPTVTGVDGKQRSFKDPRKKRKNNPTAGDLVGRLKF